MKIKDVIWIKILKLACHTSFKADLSIAVTYDYFCEAISLKFLFQTVNALFTADCFTVPSANCVF
jgi:hypothetical protein